MKTKQQHGAIAKSSVIIMTIFVISWSGTSQAANSRGELALLESVNKWQVTRLFKPKQTQRKLEQKGYITIYDNLPDVTVEKALDRNFSRIENMMFTRVIVTDKHGQPALDESGNIIIEDDGC